jgi:hypothetical protein
MPDREPKPTTLSDIADIFMGVTVSHYAKSPINDIDAVQLITASSIDETGNVAEDKLSFVWPHARSDIAHLFIRQGDILMLTRGNIRAISIDLPSTDIDRLASANFAIIRPRNPETSSIYLTELLNSSVSQKRMGLFLIMSTPSIRASDLKQLALPQITLGDQQAISDIVESRNEAYRATLALAEQQHRTASCLIDTIMRSESW